MSVLREPIFWLSQAVTVTLLSGAGVLIAYLVVPKPPTYFRTTYFEFAVPPGWNCEPEGATTVCDPQGPPPHDAIIVFAGKLRDNNDTRDDYFERLKKPVTRNDAAGKKYQSEVLRCEKKAIGEYRWVDALHLGSEIPQYYTRYLATTTAQIGMLFTFSAHRSTVEKRTKQFQAAVESLRIYQTPSRYD